MSKRWFLLADGQITNLFEIESNGHTFVSAY